MATAVLAVALLCCCALAGGSGDASCSAGSGTGSCTTKDDGAARRKEFWAEMKKRGMQIKMKRKTVEEKAQAGRSARNRSAMVLADDVFYGRAIQKIPRRALLSLETTANAALRRELTDFLFEDKVLEKRFNITSEDSAHLLSLALPLVAENRDPDSFFREWLDAAAGERLFVLGLTDRQLRVLNGTTVEGAYEEMATSRDIIYDTAGNISYFKNWPMTLEEAMWAQAVIMRHARVVHPHQDVRETRHPRMYLFPMRELLDVQLHPDPNLAVSYQEEITLEDGKREEEMVLQIARRDMPKGEEIFLWPGRLSNSEMVVRHGQAFAENHVGIGRNATQPPNWNDNSESNVRKEYDKYNCSSLESFELRITAKGLPMRNFVRCYRVSWFLTQGWYTPGYASRIRELNKWPPPTKYTKEDWLAWTQCDQEINRVIIDYCQLMRERLKESMDAELAADFRASKDPADKLLWHLRGEETRSFKECLVIAKKVKTGR